MKRIVTLLLIVLIAPAVVARAGKVVTDSVDSKTLGAKVTFNVYLPDSFETAPARHYPFVYLLHGLTDEYDAWVSKGNMQTVVDELIGTGEACEMVIIMPNAGGPDIHATWNGYFNMPGWRYEDFFFGELVPTVEERYRGIGTKGARAVMGLSMGGGGSVVYAQRHPDMFSSCYAMSAWLDNKSDEVSASQDQPRDCFYYLSAAVRERSALDFVDTAGEEELQALRSVAWFIDCGDDDFLFDQNVALHQKMRRRGVKSELRVRNGIHNWEYWHTALRLSLPFASRNFDPSAR